MSSSNQLKATVIVCTYNPRRDVFARVLHSLSLQTIPLPAWELILVDNNSGTSLALDYPIDWHPNVQWLHEPEQGKVFALMRGIERSRAGLVITVDDDSLPTPTYLQNAIEIRSYYPILGAFGAGKTVPETQARLPAWLAYDYGLLAIRSADKISISNTIEEGNRPWGLGLCVTRAVAEAWLAYCKNDLPKEMLRMGRKATALDDDLFSICAVKMGLKFGIFPQLQLTHLISERRLNLPYLSRLAYDQSYSNALLGILCNLSLMNSHQAGSIKAFLMLVLKGRLTLARIELQRFVTHNSLPFEARQLSESRRRGWEQAMIDVRALSTMR